MVPDFDKPFKLVIDVSDIGTGAVLMQEDGNKIDHPICFHSKKFNASQCNVCTSEKELLALVLALQHFNIYVTAAEGPVVVFTDHNPLIYEEFEEQKLEIAPVELIATAILFGDKAHLRLGQHNRRCFITSWLMVLVRL